MECKRLKFENVILLVMDVQALAETNHITRPLVQLIRACHAMEIPEIWVEHCPSKIGGTSILAVKDALISVGAVGPIAKTTFSAVDNNEFCFQLLQIVCRKKGVTSKTFKVLENTSATLFELHAALRQVSAGITILMSGSENHVCIYQTTLCLRNLGFGVQIVTDATTAREQLYVDVGNARCVEMGAKLTTGEMVLLEMLKDCNDPRWRKLFKIFKECTQNPGTTPSAPPASPSPPSSE